MIWVKSCFVLLLMAYQMSPGGSSSGGGSGSPFTGRGPYGVGDTTYTKVFVGGLAWETKSESLRSYFEQFGDIIEAVVITDKHTGRSKGYGFVSFSSSSSLIMMISLVFCSDQYYCWTICSLRCFDDWKTVTLTV